MTIGKAAQDPNAHFLNLWKVDIPEVIRVGDFVDDDSLETGIANVHVFPDKGDLVHDGVLIATHQHHQARVGIL